MRQYSGVLYGDSLIHNTCNAKFLGLIIDNTLIWKDHSNQLAIKLSSAAYAIRTLSSVMSQASLVMTYYAYVHSIMSYRTIFWASSAYSSFILKIKKRMVDFPTRVSNTLVTAIDNIFINRNINKTVSIIPLHNGLSDHDAQLPTLGTTPFF
jgi:hypothetical protein